MMRELIRHILKENNLKQELKKIIEDDNIFKAADLVGGMDNLKSIFKDDPEYPQMLDGLTGVVDFEYHDAFKDPRFVVFPIKYEIIGVEKNIWGTHSWPLLNVIYDDSKLTSAEKKKLITILATIQNDSTVGKIETNLPEIKNSNYFDVRQINGNDVDIHDVEFPFSKEDVKRIHDKLYGGNQSLNESEEKQAKYLNILKDLVEPFKYEDCVCGVKVWYNDEDDMYLIDVEVGTQEMKEKFFAEIGKTHYVKKLRLKIKETIKDYLPIDNFYVGTYATPKCGTKRWWDDSLNEGSNKEKSLIKIIENQGLYDFIEMTGLDFNKVRSLIKQMDNPKEILKQYIREFVLEHDGTSDGNYGSLFALRLPLSNIKYVNDILVQDSDQIAVEIWGYEEDEYGHTEQTEQYLTSINNLTNDELLSIISWMMETIEGGYWD